ncbi:MAG: epoxyqueuosine reductase QueH [Actinobacteria bacterium]|nr:epoxyqueuosine reductase QueH [Actinomycetota bacterium]
MKLLVHTCCGPCAIYPLGALAEGGHAVTGFWYNPNIHPYKEYERRLETLKGMAAARDLPLIGKDSYDLEDFLNRVVGTPRPEHCRLCYRMRLEEAARTAAEEGFPAFTTSLLISPYQKHETVREEGEAAAARHGVRFFYQDFRPHWREGVALSKEAGLYRQPYCGCIFSEKERYWRNNNA